MLFNSKQCTLRKNDFFLFSKQNYIQISINFTSFILFLCTHFNFLVSPGFKVLDMWEIFNMQEIDFHPALWFRDRWDCTDHKYFAPPFWSSQAHHFLTYLLLLLFNFCCFFLFTIFALYFHSHSLFWKTVSFWVAVIWMTFYTFLYLYVKSVFEFEKKIHEQYIIEQCMVTELFILKSLNISLI